MVLTMYHGSSAGEVSLHQGLCFTDDVERARDYALYGGFGPVRYVHSAVIDFDGLVVAEMDGFDRDENVAPGDLAASGGADVIVYDDETPAGRRHRTYRLLTAAALARLTVTGIESEEA